MSLHRPWMMSVFVSLWLGGILLGNIALAETDMAGQKVYQKKCQSCHGEAGKGNEKMKKRLKVEIPILSKTTLEQKDDAEILHTIAEGKGKMKGFEKSLSTEQRQQVLEYIKTLGQ